MPKRYRIPSQFHNASLSEITGWPPSVIDEQAEEDLEMIALFKDIKRIATEGGEFE